MKTLGNLATALLAIAVVTACSDQTDAPEMEVEMEATAPLTDNREPKTEIPAGTPVPAMAAEPAASGDSIAERLDMALSGAHRSQENAARDQYRHPAETLQFFGLEPEMRVIEIWPGGGWYTEVLGPVVRDDGQLVIAGYDKNDAEGPEYRLRLQNNLEAKLAADAEAYGAPEIIAYNPPTLNSLGEPNSADMVVTFRSIHGWVQSGIDQEVFIDMARVLRPGGILGVVQHRAPAGSDPQTMAEKGYVPEEYVIQLAQNAGLVMAGRSPINANPADTKDYADGVWTLPPTLRLGETDQEKYLAIGESDRMTLKFIKPHGTDEVIIPGTIQPTRVPPKPSRGIGDGDGDG